VSMNMESPCPTSMKWTVTLAPVWDEAGGMKQTAIRTARNVAAFLFIM